MLGDLGIGGILADDMGLGKTVQAIAMLVSEREEDGRGCVRADARRVPDERRAAVGARRSSASRRRCACICITGAIGSRARSCSGKAREVDVVVTSYDIATRDVEMLAARRSGTGCCSTRRRT